MSQISHMNKIYIFPFFANLNELNDSPFDMFPNV